MDAELGDQGVCQTKNASLPPPRPFPTRATPGKHVLLEGQVAGLCARARQKAAARSSQPSAPGLREDLASEAPENSYNKARASGVAKAMQGGISGQRGEQGGGGALCSRCAPPRSSTRVVSRATAPQRRGWKVAYRSKQKISNLPEQTVSPRTERDSSHSTAGVHGKHGLHARRDARPARPAHAGAHGLGQGEAGARRRHTRGGAWPRCRGRVWCSHRGCRQRAANSTCKEMCTLVPGPAGRALFRGLWIWAMQSIPISAYRRIAPWLPGLAHDKTDRWRFILI